MYYKNQILIPIILSFLISLIGCSDSSSISNTDSDSTQSPSIIVETAKDSKDDKPNMAEAKQNKSDELNPKGPMKADYTKVKRVKADFKKFIDKDNWFREDDAHLNIHTDYSLCAEQVLDDIAIPKLQENGYPFNSYEELENSKLSSIEKKELDNVIFVDEKTVSEMKAYFKECMSNKGYSKK